MWQSAWGLVLLVAGAVLSVAVSAHAGDALPEEVRFAAAPAWVLPAEEWDASKVTPTAGVAYLLEDGQTRYVGGHTTQFVRWVREARTEVGTGSLGQLSFRFQPSYQKLVFHRLDVRRGSQVWSRLRRDAVRVLQREQGLEESLFSGAKTALLLVPDVQVGDVVTCEYSVVGDNPVLGGHLATEWVQGGFASFAHLRLALFSDRALSAKQFALAAPPRHQLGSGVHVYSWSNDGLVAQTREELVPADYFALPWVQFSDFDSWPEVNDWGRRLFVLPEVLPDALKPVLGEIRANAHTPSEQVVATLRWVQEHVRYFAFALAENTHRPAALATIVERRFGDCKEKSLLTVALLRALGIPADVTLVNTVWGRRLNESLPSIQAFDHAIVRARIGGHSYFIDPSRLFQRGKLSEVEVSGFGFGLALSPEEPGLVPVPDPVSARPTIASHLEFSVADSTGRAQLTARVTYGGARAERLRALHASMNEVEFGKVARDAVLAIYPRAQVLGALEYTDNEEKNSVSLRQAFDIASEWSNGVDGARTLQLAAPTLSRLLPPLAADRSQPLALEFPQWVTEDLEVFSPAAERFSADRGTEDFPWFGFFYRAEPMAGGARIHFEYSARAGMVERFDFDKYEKARQKYHQKIAYTLSFGGTPAGTSATTLRWTLVPFTQAALMFAAVAYALRKRPYFRRPKVRWNPYLTGFGGPLLLVAIGMVVGPFRVLATIVNAWRQQGSTLLLSWPIASAVASWQFALLAGQCCASYLFFRKNRSFPWFYVVYWAQLGLDFLLDQLANSGVAARVNWGTDLAPLVVGACWGAYLLESERVKATFLPPPDAAPEGESERQPEPQRSAGADEEDAPDSEPGKAGA